MHDFRYIGGRLYCEQVPVETLVRKHGTPLYVYSQATLTEHFKRLDAALDPLPHSICFAVKSNSNLAVLRTMANLGSGFDIVSEGELRRVIAAGGDPRTCVFAGVGKSEDEISFALSRDIYCFNVESEPELERIDRIAARLRKKAPIAVRVNPNIDALTHAKITTGTYENKFGIAFERVEQVYVRASRLKHLRLRGVQMHIGSQLTEVKPFEQAVAKVAPLAARLGRRFGLEFFSLGGGLGIVYRPALDSGDASWWTSRAARNILTPESYAAAVLPHLRSLDLRILIEPGRFVSGNAGLLISRIEYIKQTGRKTFVIVDAAMNDLIRPAFYDSFHEILPVHQHNGPLVPSDVVGPICESGDCFCKDRPLPRLKAGESLAIFSAGAYGFVMASNYNSRGLAAEIMVHGRRAAVVNRRQKLSEIWEREQIPAWLKKR
ncbi:MAG TPA: diaminopimelate decarboxylase [Candidatus Paceibacterota bacterium]|nr:diaminopimelate decarboxylase [Verrucomicrobiota bacterium]HRY47138.1 diaminopimelate decarboxylase [Candidatus Paceibacterota bacterium]HSA02344.1 diaminopimelate decarboxylase [Candidatus Paceibacterota bacterium]